MKNLGQISLLLIVFLSFSAQAVELCKNGKLRCRELIKHSKPVYGVCIKETCANSKKGDFRCKTGSNSCKGARNSYNACLEINCGAQKGCAVGKKECKALGLKYWDCVSQACLGSIDRYLTMVGKVNKKVAQKKIIKQKDIAKRTIRTKRVGANIRNNLRCKNPSDTLFCTSTNIASCKCGIYGNLPIFVK